MPDEEFLTFRYPGSRVYTSDTGRIGRDIHYVRALLEVDVTLMLKKIKEIRASGVKTSFLAYFLKLLADSVAEHPPINGIQREARIIKVPTNINISTIVEKEVDGVRVPLPLVLHDVNHKTHFNIYEEIAAAVNQSIEDEGDYVLGKDKGQFWLRLAAGLPQWLRLFVMRNFILRSPQRVQKMMGTVIVTSLGTVGRISGWIIPTSMHPLSIGIGSLNKKPAIYNGSIEKRDILHLTIAFDHDVIDGMPALSFVDALVAKMEKGL